MKNAVQSCVLYSGVAWVLHYVLLYPVQDGQPFLSTSKTPSRQQNLTYGHKHVKVHKEAVTKYIYTSSTNHLHNFYHPCGH